MQGPTYEERTKRITVAIPKSLHSTVTLKLPFSSYTTISELIRDLLREWAKGEILKVKQIGSIAE